MNVGRDSVVGIAARYGLNGPEIGSRWEARFSSPVQTSCEAHPASYTMSTGFFFHGVNRPRRDVDHPHSPSAEVKDNNSTPHLGAFMAYSQIQFSWICAHYKLFQAHHSFLLVLPALKRPFQAVINVLSTDDNNRYLLARTSRLPVVEWTDALADLNGLARFSKTKSGFCACAITFQLHSTTIIWGEKISSELGEREV
jgi:hypothetical protein